MLEDTQQPKAPHPHSSHPPRPLFVPVTPHTLAGRWKPARCSVASGCRGLELSRTCGQRQAQQCPQPIPTPQPTPYLVRGLQTDAARPRGLGLQLAGERQHLQVGGRQAGEVPGALGEFGDCGHGGEEPVTPTAARGPAAPTRTHPSARSRPAGDGDAARRAARPGGAAPAGPGSRPALRARCTRSAPRPAGGPRVSSARPGASPHPGALGLYLQRGAAQKRAGVSHDMRYPRHARCVPPRTP